MFTKRVSKGCLFSFACAVVRRNKEPEKKRGVKGEGRGGQDRTTTQENLDNI